MKNIVIYAGRFQPWGKHHMAAYTHLTSKFSPEDVYVATSGKTETGKSPLTFAQKKAIMVKAGVPADRIVEMTSLYNADEIVEKTGVDPRKTALIAAVGFKDASRLKGKYYVALTRPQQLSPMSSRGYYWLIPDQMSGDGDVASSTQIRNLARLRKKKELEKLVVPDTVDLIMSAFAETTLGDAFAAAVPHSYLEHFASENVEASFNIYEEAAKNSKYEATEPTEIVAAAMLRSGMPIKEAYTSREIVDALKYLKGVTLHNYSGNVIKLAHKVETFLASASMTLGMRHVMGIGAKKIDAVLLVGRANLTQMGYGHLDPQVEGMKDYNSSDIIVHMGDKTYGFSLKKKVNGQNPTILNRSVHDFLAMTSVEKSELEHLSAMKSLYIGNAVGIEDPQNHAQVNERIRSMDKEYEMKKAKATARGEKVNMKRPSQEMIGAKMASPDNFYFKEIHKIVTENADEIVRKFLSESFREELHKIPKKHGFDVWMITGHGKVDKKTGVGVVLSPTVIHMKSAMKKVFDMHSLGRIEAIDSPTRKHAFVPGSSGGGLYYQILAGGKAILDIDVRYKGDYKTNPQFFAYPTKYFDELLAEKI